MALLDVRTTLNIVRIIKFEIKFENNIVEIKKEVKEKSDLATAAIQKSNANSDIAVEIKQEVQEICDLANAAIEKSNANSDITVEIKREVNETRDLATAAIPKSNDPSFHLLWQDGEKVIQGLN